MQSVEGRTCGDCTLCCKLMKIVELDKKEGLWCGHCRPGVGCAAYATRPSECRSFTCGWLTNPDLDDAWKPNRARMVVTLEDEGRMVAVHVDPSQPRAWMQPPFYAKLKHWARLAEASDRLVMVRIGSRALVVFPDRDVDIGAMQNGDRIVTERRGALREARRAAPI